MKITSTKELRDDIKSTLSSGKKFNIESRDYNTNDANKGKDGLNNFVDDFIYLNAESYSPLLYLSNLVQSSARLHSIVVEKTQPEPINVTAEGAAISQPDSDFYIVQLQAKKITEINKLTLDTIRNTNTDFIAYSTERISRKLYKSIEKSMITGSGAAGQPQGLLRYSTASNALGGAAKETNTAVGSKAIQVVDLESAYEKLSYAHQRNAVLLVSPSCLNYLRTLKDGDGEAVIQGKLEKDVRFVFDCPVIVSEYMQDMSTAGNVPAMFVDVEDAMTVLVQDGMGLTIMNELYAGKDLVGVKGSIHCDSKITNHSAISAIKLG